MPSAAITSMTTGHGAPGQADGSPLERVSVTMMPPAPDATALHSSTPEAGSGVRGCVGVLGMGSFVSPPLLSRLALAGYASWPIASRANAEDRVPAVATPEGITAAVALCPLWGLVDRLPALTTLGIRRIVTVSSMSRVTKAASPDPAERAVAERLAAAEDALERWAERHATRVTILRPTLVYDGRHDRNVTRIAGFVRRWRFFPLVGAGCGLRQPLHADDLAAACVAALDAPSPRPCYDIAGGETLTYRDMVSRIFVAVGRHPRFVQVPRMFVRATLPMLGFLPGFRGVSAAAFDRMNEPLVADNAAAVVDLGFAPRPFTASSGSQP